MAAQQPWFVAERAEVLARLYLSRHEDLDVIPVTGHMRNLGYDLLVHVRSVAVPVAFAVAVKGQLRRRVKGSRLHHVTFAIEYSPMHLESSGVPVCTFLFTVDDDRGYYRWLQRPVIGPYAAELELDPDVAKATHNGQERVKVTSDFADLNDRVIAEIVDQVKVWHEAKPQVSILSGRV